MVMTVTTVVTELMMTTENSVVVRVGTMVIPVFHAKHAIYVVKAIPTFR